MYRIFMVFLLGLLAITQSALFNQWRFLDGSLQPSIVVILCWSLLRPDEGILFAPLAGIFLDIFSGGPFGLTALGMIVASYLAGLIHGRLWVDSPFSVMVIALLGTFVTECILLLGLIVSGYTIDLGNAIIYSILPSTFLNTIIATPIFLLLRGWHRSLLPPQLAENEVD